MLHTITENQINDIEEALSSIDKCIQQYTEPFKQLSLDDGKIGLAIYFYYKNLYTGKDVFLSKARYLVEECIENLENSILQYQNKYLTDSLSNYLSGFGKALLLIENHLDSFFNFSAIHQSLQQLLIELNTQNFINNDFDLSSGALACGTYFTNHYKYMKDDTCKQHLLEIVNEIDKKKQSDDNGQTIFWGSPSLNDKVYIGISHGSAMIINFLTKLFNLQILDKTDKPKIELLTKAVDFVINQKRNYNSGYFPTFYPNNEGVITTQFTICYGDLGVAYSLYEASFFLSTSEIKTTAMQILESCAKRSLDKTYTFDAGITYGATGLFIAFEKMYRKYSMNMFKIASNYWAERIFEFRNVHKKDYAGFINRFDKNTNDIPFNLSFGWGLVGIAIGLMTNSKGDLPSIDELTIIGI